ncbi:chloride channel protein [Acinetobacter pittii]|uniref:chloride channel protein n=1 Tax=Acinetobacter pittii TaxID=48296 RepID=UPI0021CD4C10|nr:chloride channel protein [Acinetobacter pittii]MCU4710391.1 chloride channel protein [Acinetobacter pittii]
MSDETYNTNAEYQKLIYTNTLLNLYRIYLILRNICSYDNSETDNKKDKHIEFELFDDTAARISQFPLHFLPSEEINNKLVNWCSALNEFIPSSSDRFNLSILDDEKNNIAILRITEEINNFYTKKPTINKSTPEKALFHSNLAPRFESLKLTYNNGLDQLKLKNSINEAKQELAAVTNQSTELKQTISDFKETHTSFKAFAEKNYNDETKQIYDNIFQTENKLANKFRKFAIIVFLIIAVIAGINFILPTVLGLISYFNDKGFIIPSVDIFFFVKTIFMLLLTAPGWYFARESAKHRQVAYKAKIISSELSALPYYLADLEVEDRREMRMKMADKFFGQELYNDKKSDSSNLNEQTKATTETIKTVNTLLSKQNRQNESSNT